jgi:hypothetical protein
MHTEWCISTNSQAGSPEAMRELKLGLNFRAVPESGVPLRAESPFVFVLQTRSFGLLSLQKLDR